MWTGVRALGATLQIGLAAGYVLWVILAERATAGLGLWALALAVAAVLGEAAWRRGYQGDLSAAARVAGLLMLVVALGFFVALVAIEATLPSLDGF